MMKLFVLLICTVVLAGCGSVRARIVDKPRVDQDLPGYTQEAPKTRKVIVVEIAQVDQSQPVVKSKTTELRTVSTDGQSRVVTESSDTVVVHEGNFSFPGKKAGELTTGTPESFTSYTVEKDDTLQKIARKFLGSYNKWTVIYDANRDVIKNPNFLKPGTVLRIPVPEGQTSVETAPNE